MISSWCPSSSIVNHSEGPPHPLYCSLYFLTLFTHTFFNDDFLNFAIFAVYNTFICRYKEPGLVSSCLNYITSKKAYKRKTVL